MSLDKEIDRIKSEIADIGCWLTSSKTVKELIEEIIKEELKGEIF